MRQRVELTNGFAYYDLDHYIKVRKARTKAGLSVKDDDKRIDHPLIGFSFDHKDKKYTVDYVVKNWHWGFYITLALVDEGRSHRCVTWESLGTDDRSIMESIKENRKGFQILIDEEKRQV
jgi:hypothetical protein